MKKDIYIIKNDINNLVYVGQALNSKERFGGHCKPSTAKKGERIAQAIQQFGRKHFWYEILEHQIENYNERERYWIKYYNCKKPNGYNDTDGGEEPPGYAGVEHPESVLTQEQVDSLTEDLKNTNLKFSALAKKYGFKERTSVYEFNNGLTYYRDIDYPIRKDCYNGKLSDADVDNIINLLKYTYQSFEEIGKKYNVEAKAISRINRGVFHKKENQEYPIRKWKATAHPLKLSYDEVTKIISLLQSTKLSLREIARQFNVEYRDILGIKNGTTKAYRREGLTYPLRANN